jgi:DNA-binding beta-propeller fold protein YncE
MHARALARARRLRRRGAAVLVVALALALALSASALAAGETSYVLGSSVKAEGACTVTEPGGAAVDEASGEVYVLDRATSFVAHFAANGECLGRFGPAKEAKAAATVGGIAVDNAGTSPSFGDVYVTAANGKSVNKFSAEGELLSTITNELEVIHGVAVDNSGTLWVYQGKT